MWLSGVWWVSSVVEWRLVGSLEWLSGVWWVSSVVEWCLVGSLEWLSGVCSLIEVFGVLWFLLFLFGEYSFVFIW